MGFLVAGAVKGSGAARSSKEAGGRSHRWRQRFPEGKVVRTSHAAVMSRDFRIVLERLASIMHPIVAYDPYSPHS
jgi:hypothetical protein